MNTIFPKTYSSPRIAIIVDCPKKGTSQPVAESYATTLKRFLSIAKIDPASVLIGSLYPEYPGHVPTAKPTGTGKSKTYFDWTSFRKTPQILELEKTLEEFKPDIIIPLSSFSLKYFKHNPSSLDEERGAPFKDKQGRLCLATYHPRDTFTRYELGTLVIKDFEKAFHIASYGWEPSSPDILYLPTYRQVINKLTYYIEKKPLLVCDIENFYGTKIPALDGQMTCIGFAESPKEAFVIHFIHETKSKTPAWSIDEEVEIWKLLRRVLEECPLIGHNACHFDHYMLADKYGIDANFIHDTMFMQWSLYAEFPKSLGFCSSLYTYNSYWKDELSLARKGIIPKWKEFEYNGRDCAINMEVYEKLKEELLSPKNKEVKAHYEFNIKTSKAYQYMSFMGAKINKEKLQEKIEEISKEIEESQTKLGDLYKLDINPKSPKQVGDYIYKTLELPKKFNSVKQADGTVRKSLSTDYLTVLKLSHEYPQYKALRLIGNIRKLHTRFSHLKGISYDKKGICRWTFNVVGTSTGRSSGYKPYDEVGIQPQNVDRRDRDLFLPVYDDYWWLKADLEGADSVTVAAILEYLGDSRLHDDLKAGIKPAQVLALALLLKDNFVMNYSQLEIITLLGKLKTKEGKHYYKVAKMVNHGSAYKLSGGGMSTQMFQQSDGEIYMDSKECTSLQELLFKRYNYRLYHEFIEKIMLKNPVLETAGGQRRRFYGRRDHSTLREMLAFLPQAHTCFVTNTVINRLYYDNRNHLSNGNLFIKPCNQVHDETDSYIPKGQEARASKVFNSLKEVPLSIYGVPFEIKFEAEYGPSWGEQPYTL